MKKLKFLAIAMAALFTFSVTSCKDEVEGTTYELNNGEFLEFEGLGTDSTAAYPVHFRMTLQEGMLVITNMSSKPTAQAQQTPGMNNRDCPTSARISDFGKVKSLSKIDEYPAESSYAAEKAAAEGHGYVIEAHGAANLDAYGNENLHDIKSQYARVWLKETTDNGFKILYEFPFVVED